MHDNKDDFQEHNSFDFQQSKCVIFCMQCFEIKMVIAIDFLEIKMVIVKTPPQECFWRDIG